jgi:hypothetical protein
MDVSSGTVSSSLVSSKPMQMLLRALLVESLLRLLLLDDCSEIEFFPVLESKWPKPESPLRLCSLRCSSIGYKSEWPEFIREEGLLPLICMLRRFFFAWKMLKCRF